MNAKIEKLKAKHAKEIAAAEHEAEILALLEKAGAPEPRSVFKQTDCTWIKYGDSYRHGKQATPEVMQSAAAALPGLPLVWYQDTFAGIMTQEDRDASPKEYKNEGPSAPWWIEYSQHSGHELHWYTVIGGHKLRVTCAIPSNIAHRVGGIDADRGEYRGGFRYERRRICPCAESLYMIEDGDGVPVAEFGGPGCWVYAPGSEQDRGRAMLTWTPIDADRAPAVIDFVNAITR